MEKNKILIIIVIFILLALGIIGITYFITHKNENKEELEKSNETTTVLENTISSITSDTNIAVNETDDNVIEEKEEKTITETDNESVEKVEKKQETQTPTKNTSTTTQAKSNSSNNLSTSKKENVMQDTSKTTVNTNTPEAKSTTQSTSSKNEQQEETKTETKVERCTNNNNHGMDVGNSGKWYNSKGEAIAYYNQQIKYWGEKWENNEIDNDTYYKNCPSGYEVWDCMYCGKWTINFYYR